MFAFKFTQNIYCKANVSTPNDLPSWSVHDWNNHSEEIFCNFYWDLKLSLNSTWIETDTNFNVSNHWYDWILFLFPFSSFFFPLMQPSLFLHRNEIKKYLSTSGKPSFNNVEAKISLPFFIACPAFSIAFNGM